MSYNVKLIKEYPGSPELGTIVSEQYLKDTYGSLNDEFWEMQLPRNIDYSIINGVVSEVVIIPEHVILYPSEAAPRDVVIRPGDMVASLVKNPFPVRYIEIIKGNPDWCVFSDHEKDHQGSYPTINNTCVSWEVVKIDNSIAPVDLWSLFTPLCKNGFSYPIDFWKACITQNDLKRVMHEDTFINLKTMVMLFRNGIIGNTHVRTPMSKYQWMFDDNAIIEHFRNSHKRSLI